MLEELVVEVNEVVLDTVDDEFDEGNITIANVLMEVTVTAFAFPTDEAD